MANEKQEKEEENVTEQATDENTNVGVQQEEPDITKRAREEREKLTTQNERLEKNLKELRELEARRTLGGNTEAGNTPQEKKEDSPIDYSKKLLTGELNDNLPETPKE